MSELPPAERPEDLEAARLAAEGAAVAPEEEAVRAEEVTGGAPVEAGAVVEPEAEAAAAVEPAERAKATPSPADVAALAAKNRRDRRAAEAEPAAAAEESADEGAKAEDDKDKADDGHAAAEPEVEVADASKKVADELAESLGFADADALLHNFDQMRAALANPKQRKMAERMLRESDAKYQKAFAAYDADRSAAEAAPAPAESETEVKSRAEADTTPKPREELETENRDLRAENARLHERVTQLEAQVAKLTDEVAKLRELIESRGLPDPTRTPDRTPAPDDSDTGRRDADRRSRERYEAPKADPDAVDVFESVRAQEIARVRALLDQWRTDGIVKDADALNRMWEDLSKGVFASAAAASVAAGNARREAGKPDYDRAEARHARELSDKDQEIADLRGLVPKRRLKKYGLDSEGAETDEAETEGDESEPATPDERAEARARFDAEMAGEDGEDEVDDLSEGGLRARLKRMFSRGRRTEEVDEETDEEGEDGESEPATPEERERARDRFRRRMAGRMAGAALVFNIARGPEGESEPDEVRPAYATRGPVAPDEELPPYARRS